MRSSPRAPRVLLTADAVGGVWTYALDLAAGLAGQGVEVVLAVLGPAPAQAPALPLGVEMTVTGLPLDWAEVEPAALDAAGRALAELAVAQGVDLVHLNSPMLAAGADFQVPVVGGCHSCVATWWDAIRGDQPLPAEFAWRTERLRQGYLACAALIAPSQDFARATARRYGLEPRVVRNGRSAPEVESSRHRRPVAVTTGRLWDEGKGVAALDAAAGRMRHRIEAAGPLSDPTGGSVVAFRHLDVLGRLSSGGVADLLAGSAVFVSAARYEPFGLSVLEAAQVGCALVLSDLPVFRELWGEAALFVETRDEGRLARTLDGLLDDSAETERLGALARQRAERFSLDAMVAATLAIHTDALGRVTRSHEAAA